MWKPTMSPSSPNSSAESFVSSSVEIGASTSRYPCPNQLA
jgi:hypothetical protein